MADRKFADYTDKGGTEPHSECISVERSVLTDGSVAFNVLYHDNAVSLRFACTDEASAWDFADALDNCSWIEPIQATIGE